MRGRTGGLGAFHIPPHREIVGPPQRRNATAALTTNVMETTSMANAYDTTDTAIITISAEDIQTLADRLFARGISSLSTYSVREQRDLILASRLLRELLRRYERAAGGQLTAILMEAR